MQSSKQVRFATFVLDLRRWLPIVVLVIVYKKLVDLYAKHDVKKIEDNQLLEQTFGMSTEMIADDWHLPDENALVKDSLEMVVQVNGKVRAKLTVPANADKQSVETMAREEPNVVRFIEDKTIRKVIVVPGKLVNIVAN